MSRALHRSVVAEMRGALAVEAGFSRPRGATMAELHRPQVPEGFVAAPGSCGAGGCPLAPGIKREAWTDGSEQIEGYVPWAGLGLAGEMPAGGRPWESGAPRGETRSRSREMGVGVVDRLRLGEAAGPYRGSGINVWGEGSFAEWQYAQALAEYRESHPPDEGEAGGGSTGGGEGMILMVGTDRWAVRLPERRAQRSRPTSENYLSSA